MALKVMDLPSELVAEILSYGDVMVTQKYDGVLRQLKYHTKEFHYHRNYNPKSQWYYKPTTHYKFYILMKNQIKMNLDKYIYTSKPSKMYNINCVYTEIYNLTNFPNLTDVYIINNLT
jgi:hypothetical protein